MGFPLIGRIEVGWMFIAETIYAYFLVLRLRKGLPRVLALQPLVPLSLLVIWRVPTATERTIYCCCSIWMLNLKFLPLAWDKGLAADSSAENHGLVKESEADVAGKKTSQSGGKMVEKAEVEPPAKVLSWIRMAATSQDLPILLLRSLVYYIVGTSLLRMILIWKDVLPQSVLDLLLGFFHYFCLLLLEMPAVIPASIGGTEVQPMFNMPILADSLGDFWGRRWNLHVTNVMRVCVYEPVLIFLARGKKPALVDRAISTWVTFFVSGLAHEVYLFCAVQTKPSWEMTTFFVVNGAGTVLERFVKGRYGFRVPRLLGRAYTLTFVYLTASWLFFPPIRSGLLDGMAYLLASIDGIKQMIWLK